MPLVSTIAPNSLLSRSEFERSARMHGLEPAGLERLIATDRVLRYLVANRALPGYALAGPAALHGIYLWDGTLRRVPDELTVVPVRGMPALASPAELAAFAAGALPEARLVEPDADDPELYRIAYAGTTGPAELRLRLGRLPLSLPTPPEATGALLAERGYLADPRFAFFNGVEQVGVGVTAAYPLPVAYAEEIMLHTLVAIARGAAPAASRGRTDDVAARVDDLRLALARAEADTLAAIGGEVRELFATQISGDASARLAQLSAAVRSVAGRFSAPGALAAELRPRSAMPSSDDELAFRPLLAEALRRLAGEASR